MAKTKMVDIKAVISHIYAGKIYSVGETITVDENEAERLLAKPEMYSQIKGMAVKPEQPAKSEGVE